MMPIRCGLVLTLLSMAGHAQWIRYVSGQLDSPPPHDLAYFRVHPCLRSEGPRRVIEGCGLPPSQASELSSRTYTKLNVAGHIGAFTIFDLQYYFNGPEDPGNPAQSDARSVLVQTGPDQFHEIHVMENTNGTMIPSQIVRKTAGYSILRVRCNDNGMYRLFDEQFFAISATGVVYLDFSAVYEAAKQVVPENMATYQAMCGLDFRAMTFYIWTERTDVNAGPKVACCLGKAEVPFTIRQERVVAGKARYIPGVRPVPFR
jgi:hypothetical protein